MSALFGPNLILYVLGAALIACVIAFFKGRIDGANLERAKEDKARLEAIKAKKETDDEVNSLAPADLDARFKRWM